MKRHPSNTIQQTVRAMAAAQLGPIEPPPYVRLRDGDRAFWDAIVRARARDTWTESDLAAAAHLSRARADIERLQAEIDGEGDVVENARGTPVMNPKHTVLEVLSRRALALSRAILVHGEATVGKARDAAKSAVAQREAELKIAGHDDELIPRLRAV